MKKSKLIIVSANKTQVKEILFDRKKLILFGLASFIVLFFIISVSTLLYNKYNTSAEISALQQKNSVLAKEYGLVESKITRIVEILKNIKEVDDGLRINTGLVSLDEEIRNLGIGGIGVEYYYDDNLTDEEKDRLTKNKITLEDLERKLNFELESYKNVYKVVEAKEDSVRFLPTMIPIPDDIYHVSSDFGRRMHPILNTIRNHEGIDLSAEIGTPVYATADGFVEFSGLSGGYGNLVKIKHKSTSKDYGYETRYGHLSVIFVKYGEFVKRGDLIAEVGSTGLSSSPHLHYEVRMHGDPLKPNQYYFVNK